MFCQEVRPQILSYDHYHFHAGGDGPDYFRNLALVRERALEADLPFLNIVQASSWTPGSLASPASPRVPGPDELRFLVYTTLAYGAQGISYYIYSYPGHEGGFVNFGDRSPTPLFETAKSLNREFLRIASILQPMRAVGVYHVGMQQPGTRGLAENSGFLFEPPVEPQKFVPCKNLSGILISIFSTGNEAGAKLFLIVNPAHTSERTIRLIKPGPLERFDAGTGKWSLADQLQLPRGGGILLRLAETKE